MGDAKTTGAGPRISIGFIRVASFGERPTNRPTEAVVVVVVVVIDVVPFDDFGPEARHFSEIMRLKERHDKKSNGTLN